VLPSGLGVRLRRDAWPRVPIFEWLESAGVSEHEMLRTFNCGIGMTLCVPAAEADRAIEVLRRAGEQPHRIGELRRGEREVVIEE
jgi:phosphoribosylformylglycinamidine cyclo-ligase